METLCIENYDKFKNILSRAKEKMCPNGQITVGEKMFPRKKMCPWGCIIWGKGGPMEKTFHGDIGNNLKNKQEMKDSRFMKWNNCIN